RTRHPPSGDTRPACHRSEIVNQHILPPGPHGGDAGRVAKSLGLDAGEVIDLSASLNPVAPDVSALVPDLLGEDRTTLGRYPDPTVATERLAAALDVAADRLVLTNGAAEAIALVAAELPVGDVVEPEFSLYRRHLGEVRPGAPRWRSNPSNPLGHLAEPEATATVWDESFHPLATGQWSRGDDGAWRILSLTKIWACPGLRIGCVIAPDADDAEAIRRRQPRWAVNGLALAAVPRLLEQTDLTRWSQQIAVSRTALLGELARLGFVARTTDANWVLVDHADLRTQLAQHGIVVRDCASFGLGGVFRVALPRPDELDRVLSAFEAIAP
ncbi:MAG: aminotransferase class I/II-fold pyridoxal phosphate-dependent enzyme, partial [Actinomycetota bacterium]